MPTTTPKDPQDIIEADMPSNTPTAPQEATEADAPGRAGSKLRELPADGNFDLMKYFDTKWTNNKKKNHKDEDLPSANNRIRVYTPAADPPITTRTPDARTARVTVLPLPHAPYPYPHAATAPGRQPEPPQPIVLPGRDCPVNIGLLNRPTFFLDLSAHEPRARARASLLVHYPEDRHWRGYSRDDPRCRVHPTQYKRAAGPDPCPECAIVEVGGGGGVLRLCHFCAGWARRVGTDCFRCKMCVCGALDARAWLVRVNGAEHRGPFSPRLTRAGALWDARQAAAKCEMYGMSPEEEEEKGVDREENKAVVGLDSSDSDSCALSDTSFVFEKLQRVSRHYDRSDENDGYEADVSDAEASGNPSSGL